MINRAHRFHGRSSLRFVYQKGQTVRAGSISLRYAHNTRQPSYRMAVVVSRKVSKSAVVRNRVRRRLYEIVRKHAGRISGPYDLILTVYDEHVADMSHATLQQAVLGMLSKAAILSDTPAPEAGHDIVDEKETNI